MDSSKRQMNVISVYGYFSLNIPRYPNLWIASNLAFMLDKYQCLYYKIFVAPSRVTLIEKEGMRTALILMTMSPYYKCKFRHEASAIEKSSLILFLNFLLLTSWIICLHACKSVIDIFRTRDFPLADRLLQIKKLKGKHQ